MTQKTAYITTPIYYPSGAPHLGTAYTSVATDVYARFKRLDGFDVLSLTGADEHGMKIQRKAEEMGISPQAYVDNMAKMFQNLTPVMNLSNDDYIRTTEERHKKAVVEMWKRLEAKGYIYKDKYAGWYSVSDETYYTEEELINGKSPDSGHPVEWVEEESYYFKLSAFQEKLMKLYEEKPDFIKPTARRNEIMSFVKGGLRDLSISRTTFDWGVKVPGDDKHVVYVWIDALTNYLSALDWPNGEKMKYWENAIHVVGKDIIRFHTVYWPAMLMAADVALPKQIFAHGWWTVDGDKMSKSKGNVIDPVDLVEEFGSDTIRYFMMREVTFGNDGDYSRSRLIERANADLSNALGNLFQRVLSMVYKNCDAKVPAYLELTQDDKQFISSFDSLLKNTREQMDNLAFSKVIEVVWQAVSAANVYMDAQAPWTLKNENPEKMAHVLRVLMESFRYISLLVEPVMPAAAKKLQHQLGYENKKFADLEGDFFKLTTGSSIEKPEGVFMRIQDEKAA